jgi:hypothetical protein
MRTIVLRNGLLAGAIMATVFALTVPVHDRLGYDWGMVVGYTSMVAAFMLIWFGVKTYGHEVGGPVGFWRALGLGMGIALVASVVYALAWEVIYRTAMSDFLVKYQAYALEKARAAGATAAELSAQRAEMEAFAVQYRHPLFRAAVTMMEPMPVGLLISLVTAFVHRRREASAPALATSSTASAA